MGQTPIDNELILGYDKNDVFQILVIGMFIYACGKSIANVITKLAKDIGILLDYNSMYTFFVSEGLYYLVILLFATLISNFIYKNIRQKDFSYNKLLWGLIAGYISFQLISIAYNYFEYEYLGSDFLIKSSEYNSELLISNYYHSLSSLLGYIPFIFIPMILFIYSKKLNK